MNLSKRREEWEKGCKPVLTITKKDGNYSVVYVILDNRQLYSLHRYFQIGNSWEVSVDISRQSLECCMSKITNVFLEFYPRC